MPFYNDSFAQLLREIAEELGLELIQNHLRSAIFKNAHEKISEIYTLFENSTVILPDDIPTSEVIVSIDKRNAKNVSVEYFAHTADSISGRE